MPVTASVIYTLKGNNFVEYIFNIVWPSTGTYPALGERLDFSPLVGITNRQPVWVDIQIFGGGSPPLGNSGYYLWYDKVERNIRVRAGSIIHTHRENTDFLYTQNAETEPPTPLAGIWPEMSTGYNYVSTLLPSSVIEARVTFAYR